MQFVVLDIFGARMLVDIETINSKLDDISKRIDKLSGK